MLLSRKNGESTSGKKGPLKNILLSFIVAANIVACTDGEISTKVQKFLDKRETYQDSTGTRELRRTLNLDLDTVLEDQLTKTELDEISRYSDLAKKWGIQTLDLKSHGSPDHGSFDPRGPRSLYRANHGTEDVSSEPRSTIPSNPNGDREGTTNND